MYQVDVAYCYRPSSGTCVDHNTSDHIVAQQANRYIVAFHIAISYNTQRPPYNGRAVGLRRGPRYVRPAGGVGNCSAGGVGGGRWMRRLACCCCCRPV